LESGSSAKDLVERPAISGSFSFLTRARDILSVMGNLLHYAAVLLVFSPYVFCLLKGKYIMALWCFLLFPLGGLLFALIGAIRLGHASSLWGRKFYDEEQIVEANRRFKSKWSETEDDAVEQAPSEATDSEPS